MKERRRLLRAWTRVCSEGLAEGVVRVSGSGSRVSIRVDVEQLEWVEGRRRAMIFLVCHPDQHDWVVCDDTDGGLPTWMCGCTAPLLCSVEVHFRVRCGSVYKLSKRVFE